MIASHFLSALAAESWTPLRGGSAACPLCVCVCVRSAPGGPQLKEAASDLLPWSSAELLREGTRHERCVSRVSGRVSGRVSDNSQGVHASVTHLIGSHWHSSHSHGVHAHLALHLAVPGARHLAHRAGRVGPAHRPGSAHGVVHHHGSKLTLVGLRRELLLGVGTRKKTKTEK